MTRVIREKEKLQRVCGITVRVLEAKDIGEWRYASFLGHLADRDRDRKKTSEKKGCRKVSFETGGKFPPEM